MGTFTVGRVLTVVSVALLLSGCVSVMKAKPQDLEVGPVNGSVVPAGTVRIEVTDLLLNTNKPEREIGEGRVGFFNRRVPILGSEPANVIVSTAIKRALEDKGMALSSTEDAKVRLEGSLEQFWVSEYATGFSLEYAKAHIRYDIVLRDRNGKTLWATTMERFKTSEVSMEATKHDLPTLKAALEESVSELIDDQEFRRALAENAE